MKIDGFITKDKVERILKVLGYRKSEIKKIRAWSPTKVDISFRDERPTITVPKEHL